MRKLLLSSVALLSVFASACATEEETQVVGGDDVEEVEDEGQAAVERPALAYPAGPFGDEEGSIIRNYQFRGYARPQDGYFDAAQVVQMADFYNPTGTEMFAADSVYGEKPKPKALMIIISAAWCEPCKLEAQSLPGEYADYAPMGAEFFTVMAQNVSGGEPKLSVLSAWQSKYNQSWPGVVDGQDKLFALAAGPAFPANILIDTRTMTIVDRVAGADPAIFAKLGQLLSQ
jgi:thiol-disulfide isomerase/thioredoxin